MCPMRDGGIFMNHEIRPSRGDLSKYELRLWQGQRSTNCERITLAGAPRILLDKRSKREAR